MNEFQKAAEKSNVPDAANLMGFNIKKSPWSRVKHEFAKQGATESDLRRCLHAGFGLTFGDIKDDDLLYFVVSQEQLESLAEGGNDKPTVLQLLGTSESIALDEDACRTKFLKLKNNANNA